MSLQDAIRLADSYTRTNNPKMKWMWGEGLVGYAFANLDSYLKEDRYLPFLKQYVAYWDKVDPEIMSSDTAAPGLITYDVYKRTGDEKAKRLTEKVLHYIQFEPREEENLVNHMGHNPIAKLYPKSIWVDSLMMFGVFASLYGRETGNQAFLDLASLQPILFAEKLQDQKDKLWYHTYWFKLKIHYPLRKDYWGRGNAWVISALPKILDQIEDQEKQGKIKTILKDTADALLKYQNSDGSFCTLIRKHGIYRESSATALIADGLFHAVRKGYLSADYLTSAMKAYEWCTKQIVEKDGKVLFTKISCPTIAYPPFSFCSYALLPRGANWSYGVAAYIWASIEYDLAKKVKE